MTIRTLATLTLLLCPLLAACSGAPPDDATSSVTAALPEPAEEPAEGPAEPAPAQAWGDRLRARWTLDEAFSMEEVRVIVAAGDVWSANTGGRVALTFEVGPVAPGQLWSVRRAAIEPGTLGVTTSRAEGSTMTLDADTLGGCEQKLLLVAAHELGHALGIVGHGRTGGVMTTYRVPRCEFAMMPEDLAMFGTANP